MPDPGSGENRKICGCVPGNGTRPPSAFTNEMQSRERKEDQMPTKRTRTVQPWEYHDYIAGPDWQAVKERYRASKLAQVCQGCGSDWVELHHKSYHRLGNEKLNDLVPVCRSCHQSIHDNASKYPSLWKATKKVLRSIRIESGYELYPGRGAWSHAQKDRKA